MNTETCQQQKWGKLIREFLVAYLLCTLVTLRNFVHFSHILFNFFFFCLLKLGISAAVYSVISDYCSMDSQYPVLSGSMTDDRRYLQLKGSPWSQSEEGEDLEDAICAENLTLSLIACLAKSQYKLQISINMDSKTRVFFFIKDKETKEIRLPSVGVGLGDKNSLYVHPTTITRTQTSFFRSR